MANKLTQKAQATLSNTINSVEDGLRRDTVKCMIYPDAYGCRMPDEVTQPTNLYRSLREFSLTANMDGTINAGKFSFAVKPTIGSLQEPYQYQVGIVDTSSGWPTDFSIASSYLSTNLSSDPRVDPILSQLATTTGGSYASTYTFGAFNGSNVNYQCNIFGDTSNGFVNTAGVASRTHPNVGFGFNTPGVNLTNIISYVLSPGVYMVHPSILNGGVYSTTGIIGILLVGILDGKTGILKAAITFSSGGGPDIYGTAPSQIKIISSWYGQVYNVNQSLIEDVSCAVQLQEGDELVFGFEMNAPQTISSLIGRLTFSTTTYPNLSTIVNNGSIVKLRPVACACLVTCTLPELTAGGNIVGYSAPAGDIDNYYYKSSSVLGPYQEWQNLARNNKGINTHDGNFKDGTYVWTQPWDKNDTLLRTPTEMLDYPYQGIIVSGQVNPTVQLTGNIEIGRIRIAMIYEFVSDSRLFLGENCFGSTADLDWVLAFLSTQQHATENVDHMKRLKDIVTKSARFVKNTVPSMMKGLQVASGIASMLL